MTIDIEQKIADLTQQLESGDLDEATYESAITELRQQLAGGVEGDNSSAVAEDQGEEIGSHGVLNTADVGGHIVTGEGNVVAGGDVKGVAIGPGASAVVNEGLTLEQIATLVVELRKQDLPTVWDGRIPYIGLRAFQEKDAQFFFGREALVNSLLERIQQGLRFITIAGPSGSGKSSIARAGLFHALRTGQIEGSENWVLATMSPRDNPIANLGLAFGRDLNDRQAETVLIQEAETNAAALHEQVERLSDMSDDRHRRFVLLVDQFEELFTQTTDPDSQQAFIRLLTAAVETDGSRVIVVLSLRSDFVSSCALYPELREQINRKSQFVLVGAMEPRELAVAITLPSLKVGTEIDPALVKQVVDDMKGEPGSLPLMSFALRDLFMAERPTEGPDHEMDITLLEYLSRGGLSQALERHANRVFQEFSDEQQVVARGIFTKLITVGEGRLDTRRTATFGELVPAGVSQELVAATVADLAAENTRLVTIQGIYQIGDLTSVDAGEATVTISHEKLIEAWPWLRSLVDENRELIKLQNQIHADAWSWAASEDPGFLYRGGQLARVEDRLPELGPSLDELSQRFIIAGQDQRETEIAAQAERIRQEETLVQERANADRLSRQRRWLMIASGAAVILAVLAMFFLMVARQESAVAEEARATSAANAIVAQTREAEAVEARVTAEFNETQVAELKNSIQASQLSQAADLTNDPELAMLLATAGLGLSSQPDTQVALLKAASDRFRRSLVGHTGRLTLASFSSDGSQIVTTSVDGTARLWDTAGNTLAVLEGHSGVVFSAAFSPDETQIVTASDDGTARLWDTAGNTLAVLEGHSSSVRSAYFSPDGLQIVSASGDFTARLWDTTGNALAVLEGHSGTVDSATFSSDGSRILTASGDGTARVWDLAGNTLAVLGGVNSSAFSPNGSQILTASPNATARLWNTAGNTLAVLEGHSDLVLLASFSSDGSRIVTTSVDGTARVWDTAGNTLAVLEGHTGPVIFATFSTDGLQIVTASADGTARLWDTAGNTLAVLDGHMYWVFSATFSPDGSQVVSASGDGTARLWDTDGKTLAVLEGHDGWIYSAAFNPDGSQIITASGDGTARLWDTDGKMVAVLEGHSGSVLSADFNPDGSHIVTTGWDNTVRLWDTAGNKLAVLLGHADPVFFAAFSPDGSQIVTASGDGTGRLWDTAGNTLAVFEGHSESVLSAAFSPDGSQIVTASGDGTARLWDAAGNTLAVLLGHADSVFFAAFSPDGSQIVTASGDGTARLWDSAGNTLAVFEGHSESVLSGAFSPDGSQIVTASGDGTARLWDTNGNTLIVLKGHSDGVRSVAFSMDGSQIATASKDGTVRLWQWWSSNEELIATVRTRLGDRVFTDEECVRFFANDPETCPQTLPTLWGLFEDGLAHE